MKTAIALLAILAFSATVAEAVDYSYLKVENEVVITSTETKTEATSETVNIEELEAKIAVLEVSKVNTLTYYNENIARLNAEIAVINTHIAEAKALGLTEAVAELK